MSPDTRRYQWLRQDEDDEEHDYEISYNFERDNRYGLWQVMAKVGLSFLTAIGLLLIWIGIETLLSSASAAIGREDHGGDGGGGAVQMPILVPMKASIMCPELDNLTLPARPATFGPNIPHKSYNSEGDEIDGYEGEIHVVESHGCNQKDDYEDLRGKIALVQRGECGFYEKILVLQDWGAKAVIVGDNVPHKGLVTMFTKEDVDLSRVPSVFISYDSYEVLKNNVTTIIISSSSEESPIADTLIFLLVSPLCSLSIIYGMLLFHRRYKILQERAPKSFVEKLPTRVWTGDNNNSNMHSKKQPTDEELNCDNDPTTSMNNNNSKTWASSGECIICLEDFIVGVSKVMRLPCDHEFHAECVSRWLVSRKKTCPICKQDVTKIDETSPLIKRNQHHHHDGQDPSMNG